MPEELSFFIPTYSLDCEKYPESTNLATLSKASSSLREHLFLYLD